MYRSARLFCKKHLLTYKCGGTISFYHSHNIVGTRAERDVCFLIKSLPRSFLVRAQLHGVICACGDANIFIVLPFDINLFSRIAPSNSGWIQGTNKWNPAGTLINVSFNFVEMLERKCKYFRFVYVFNLKF